MSSFSKSQSQANAYSALITYSAKQEFPAGPICDESMASAMLEEKISEIAVQQKNEQLKCLIKSEMPLCPRLIPEEIN